MAPEPFSEGDDLDTFDILQDIYGDKHTDDLSFDFVNRKEAVEYVPAPNVPEKGPLSGPDTHFSKVHTPLEFYPLLASAGHGYSSLNLLDLARIFNKQGTEDFSLGGTQYQRACIKDRSKLFKSNEKLDQGESFAIRSSSLSMVNPPVYMKYYSKPATDTDVGEAASLLSEPIDVLFRRVLESDLDDYSQKSDRGGRLFRRRKRKNRDQQDPKRENWLTKYRPAFFSDLLTTENVNLECLRWLSSWKCSSNYLPKYVEPENKILLIGGPSGVGKTCLVNVLATHCGYNVVEINSSEDRTKGRVIPIINGVVSAGSVDPKRPNLCLLEDVDTLVSSELSIIAHLKQINAKKTAKGPFIKRPIVCTCTDVYAKQLKELREISKVVVIESCDSTLLRARLESIMEEEGVLMPEEYLKEVQETHVNDIRSCLTVLEFITNYAGKYGNFSMSELTKDKNEGVAKLLRTVFKDHGSTLQSIETLLMSTVNTQGYNYTASVIGENVTLLPMKRHDHLYKLSLFQDMIAQSDVVCNNYGSPIHSIQLLKTSCAFVNKFMCPGAFFSTKFVYPQRTNFHFFNMKFNKSRNVVHTIQKASLPIVAQGILSRNFAPELLPFILKFLSKANRALNNLPIPFVLRMIKGLEGCWEGLFPRGSAKFPPSMYPLFHMAQILVAYGITIANVNQSTLFDPPVFDLYVKTNEHDVFYQIPDKFSQLLGNFLEFYETGNKSFFTDDTHFKGSAHYKSTQFLNFYEAIKYIYNHGFARFRNLNKAGDSVDSAVFNEVLCKRTHQQLVPVLFSQILSSDSASLRDFAAKRRRVGARTCGNYRYQDQNCSAVRYIINHL